MPQPEDWKRVGDLLQQQRVRLDARYRNRSLFSKERGINYRLAQDVETGARDNYEPSTLTHIELAYGWQPGDIESVLAGGQPVLVEDGADGDAQFDNSIAVIRGLPLPDKVINGMIALARGMRQQDGDEGNGHRRRA